MDIKCWSFLVKTFKRLFRDKTSFNINNDCSQTDERTWLIRHKMIWNEYTLELNAAWRSPHLTIFQHVSHLPPPTVEIYVSFFFLLRMLWFSNVSPREQYISLVENKSILTIVLKGHAQCTTGKTIEMLLRNIAFSTKIYVLLNSWRRQMENKLTNFKAL